MARSMWLLLLLALLSETAGSKVPNPASLNRNRADDNETDSLETVSPLSSLSSLSVPKEEPKPNHDDENDDVVVAINDDKDDLAFEKRTMRDEVPMLDPPDRPGDGHHRHHRRHHHRSDLTRDLLDVNALGTYLKSCSHCLETSEDPQCPLKNPAQDLKKWMLELQKLLSFGCQLGGQCGRSDTTCCYSRDAILESAIQDMTKKARHMYNEFLDACVNCPRDGQWSDWCQWSACSVTCEVGTRTRSRTCNNPTPRGAGCPCPGNAVETENCGGPPCCVDGNWGPWEPWSGCPRLACGQDGTRERRRPCDSPPPNRCGRICPGVRLQREACEGPCDPQWAEWGDWCACICRGMRSRRRLCRMDGTGAHLDFNMCGKDARQTEPCDVKYHCPACLRDGDCAGSVDGQYPSCTSCQQYVVCTSGQMQVFECNEGTEWDHDIQRCAHGSSRSCSLVDCIYDCTGREPGPYPSCDGCQFYEECPPASPTSGSPVTRRCPVGKEFNAHLGYCVVGRSPTCVVLWGSPLPNDEGRRDLMVQDAPTDSYFTADNLPEPRRQELYRELRDRVAIAAKLNRIRLEDDDDFLAIEEKEEEEEEEEVEKREGEGAGEAAEEEELGKATVVVRVTKPGQNKKRHHHLPNKEKDNHLPSITSETSSDTLTSRPVHPLTLCRKDCRNATPGYYQSCEGCRHYLLCATDGTTRHQTCPGEQVWDNALATCVQTSTTCRSL